MKKKLYKEEVKEKMRNFDEWFTDHYTAIIIVIIVFVLIPAYFILGKYRLESDRSKLMQKWNDGIHAECGGKYEYQQMIAGQSWTSYVYRCDKCGYVESFPYQMEFYDPEKD